ncbi:alcohol dehydrogenase catalytic domain-containing protein [Bacillus sp. AFS076308]|uniref:alcohol dehydrogenase catalytic domain-containing protein n=1 Tax=unclassified Bacillus (in: firmicutes) TaxID=185979 RepID=UPI0015966B87
MVEVHAASLNLVDYQTAISGNSNWVYPHILGLDSAGVVAETGDGVTHTMEKGGLCRISLGSY